MAPRGRFRKPRLTRMDAAVDAMVPYGFPEDQVRGTVKKLLKEYGGDDGWPFIEADAYVLLIEMLVSKQEEEVKGDECNAEENMLLDEPLQDERAGDCSVAAEAGPSGQDLAADAGSLDQVLAPVCSEVADAAAQTIETEGRDRLLPAKGDGKGWKDIGLDQNCDEKDMVDTIDKGDNDNDSGREMQLDHSPVQSPLYVPPSPPPPANNLPPRRRKPCYGWISSSDDEDDFIVLTPAVRLTPAKQPGQPENGINRKDKRHKRKTRWDVRPEVSEDM